MLREADIGYRLLRLLMYLRKVVETLNFRYHLFSRSPFYCDIVRFSLLGVEKGGGRGRGVEKLRVGRGLERNSELIGTW